MPRIRYEIFHIIDFYNDEFKFYSVANLNSLSITYFGELCHLVYFKHITFSVYFSFINTYV